MTCSARAAIASLAWLLLASLPDTAHGQARVLPGAERPELEPFAPGTPPPESLELPPIPPPEAEGPLATGARVFVRAFVVEGSSVFSPEELAQVTAPYSGRIISSEELLQAGNAVTALYALRGYLTSGALIPDQSVEQGIVRIQVIEGVLGSIEVTGTSRFRHGYFRTRLRRAARAPVNVFRLEEQLQIFQRDPAVRRVHAQLLPGATRGESLLALEVEENRFYGLELGFANDNSPSIGSYTGHGAPSLTNLIGYGDTWRAEVEISEGLRQYDGSVAVPLPPFDTSLGFHAQYSESDVVEEPFDDLDIHSETQTYGFTLSQPLYRSESQRLDLGITGEYRSSQTRVLGECFTFVAGTTECKDKVSVLRPFAGWTWATPLNVIAIRTMLSVGVHALGSTQRGGGLPDSGFLVWLNQAQWAHRLPEWLLGSELISRLDAQTTGDRLLGIEKFSVGGLRTVRGYVENQFVRDNGVVASIELRVPLLRDGRGRPLVELVPFSDYGRSWEAGPGADVTTIGSVGVGIRLSPWSWLNGELYWGYRLNGVPKFGDDIQNDGISFALRVTPF